MSFASRLRDALKLPAGRWLRAVAWSSLAWLAFDMLVQIQSASYYRERGLPVPWRRFFGDYGDSLIWGFVTPAIFWFVGRRPIGRTSWPRAVPTHLLAALGVGVTVMPLVQAVRSVLAVLLDEPRVYAATTDELSFRMMVQALVLYAQTAAVAHGVHYYREARDRDRRASRLEGQLAQAQLHVLRMQLQPHFLFNTLNTISALMHTDLRAADRILALLGDLLRDSLEKVGAQEVTLKQELDFIDRYLEIERTRFRDRLAIDVAVDPEALDALVPNLVLQPLVENAIRHGIARRAGGGRVTISARRLAGELVLAVRDDGPGIPEQAPMVSGVGLANTQARLAQLYGAAQRFELRNRPEGGLEVTLTLPFRSAPIASVA